MKTPSEDACRTEVARCKRSLAGGGDPAFWRRRLLWAAERYERAARVLRDQIDAIDVAESRARNDAKDGAP